MKKRILLIFLSCVIFASVFLLPCSAFISDIEDSLVVNYVYGSVDSTFTNYYQYAKETIAPGDTTEYLATLAKREIVPNYFFHQFNITSSNGLPVAEGGKTWKFAISNFSDYIRIDTENGGYFYLKSIGDCYIRFKYSNGYWSGLIKDNTVGFTYDSNTNKHSLNFKIKPQNASDIQEVEIKYFCDYSDFGLSRFTSNDDLMEYFYGISFENFMLSREEVFPTPSDVAFDNYHVVEDALLEDITPGVTSIKGVFNDLTGFFSSGPIYKGTLFVSNLLTELVGEIPIFENLLFVSLSLGAAMVIVGSVLFSVGSVRKRGDFGKDRNDKNKGG